MLAWELRGFLDRLDAWIAQENPDAGLRVGVTTWVFSRMDDPYQGVQREPSFDNVWFGVVPGSKHNNQAVLCSYFILEREHPVQCNAFATLSLPI